MFVVGRYPQNRHFRKIGICYEKYYRKDWFLTADEALKLGIVTEIIDGQ